MDERRDLDVLVAAVRLGGRPRAEVDGVDPCRAEVRDVRPGLFRLDSPRTCLEQLRQKRIVGHDASGRRVARELDLRGPRGERAQSFLGSLRRAIGRVPKADGCDSEVRDDVVGRSRLETRDADHLAKGEAADCNAAWLVLEDGRETGDRALDGVVGLPRPRGMAAPPREREARGEMPEAPCLQLAVRRLEHNREGGVVNGARAGEQGGERVVLCRELLAPEEQQPDVVPPRLAVRELAHELERDGNASFHVARAQAVDGASRDPARQVVLRRNGVVVPGEDHERRRRPPGGNEEVRLVVAVRDLQTLRHEREQMLADLGLVAALRRDVHELERAFGETLGEPCHRRSVPRHNPGVTPRQPDPAPGAEPERGFIVGVFPNGVDGEAELAELRELARTAGVAPVGELFQHRPRPDPRTFVGKGKLTELKNAYGRSDAEVLLVDEELSPVQQRSLEDALKARVVDRTQLILDIFAQHARSAEGKLQVELAQLEYNLPRMRGMWQHLERLGGGVGTRGPGESQLESDRRMARTRVSLVKRRLRGLEVQRATRRKERQRTSVPTIALAGYTNVGKSTLLNALTGAATPVDDRLFETLDPTTRAFEHDGKRYLVTDTVGFIRRLPTQLVEGFAATLEETLVADLVLHVADASLPEDRLRETIDAVHAVLREIGADDVPVELVLNKIDLLDPLGKRRLAHAFPRALQISAETGEGLDDVKSRVAELFSDRFEDVRLLVPYEEGRVLAQLYGLGAPIADRRDTPEGVRVRARLPRREIARFAPFLVAGTVGAEVSEA